MASTKKAWQDYNKSCRVSKVDPRLYKVTLHELVMLIASNGPMNKDGARDALAQALRDHGAEGTGLDKAKLTSTEVKSVKEIPRSWRNCIAFGENFTDASVEDIVNRNIYDEDYLAGKDRNCLIRRLRRDGRITDGEAQILKGSG